MEVIAIWLALAVVVAVHAGKSGRSVAAWLVTGVVLSPLIAAVLLFGFGPRQRPAARQGGSVLSGPGHAAITHSAWACLLSVVGVMAGLQILASFSA